jgi:hypothetical protein
MGEKIDVLHGKDGNVNHHRYENPQS